MVNYMFIIYSLLASFFSGLSTFFSKISLNNNSILVLGIRTIVITILTIIMYILFKGNNTITTKNIVFIILSGISTAILWLVYFKALEMANISLVTPVDKLSIVITLILSTILFKEKITIIKIISMIFIIVGTFLMVNKNNKKKDNWFIYAILTAIFTSLTTILAKIGIKNVDSNLSTMLRTIIVLIIIWIIILIKKEYKYVYKLNKKTIIFIILSGLSTGSSWLNYFKALKIGETSIVFTIEKLSVVVSILLSVIFLKEKLNIKKVIGFIFIILGIFILVLH